MKTLKKSTVVLICAAFLLSSCYSHTHIVGSGGRTDASPSNYDIKKKQWFLLYGLIPISEADTKQMVGDTKNYTIKTEQSFGDLVIGSFTGFILGLSPRTVRISKGDE